MPKETKTIEVWENSIDEASKPAVKYLEDLTKLLTKIPPEFVKDAYFEFYIYDYWANMKLCYTRTETDEEYKNRLSKEKQSRVDWKKATEEHERKEYERLKAKFEKKSRK